MKTASSLPRSARPGGRTARTASAVHEAVLTLIAERGRDGLTMKEIAATSGVHEATLYRRWRDVDTVILDAATARIIRDLPIPDTGSIRGDLLGWVSAASADLARPGGLALFEALIRADVRGQGGDVDTVRRRELAQLYREHRSVQLQNAIDRARSRGEVVPEVEVLLDRIMGPIYARAVLGYRRLDVALVDLVESALRINGR
ncbi:TetR/AcrR family transcriptional regulator [Arthrobacter sp. MI7-26]|uniref:TetR/AcrR family transcriptional regulator n=1 Tax=Arthrobacter sp. MI7-26 TaxID=2993653 RepID=UPI002248D7D0|nr:TetR/AcrR family transcriptional regulator [Arthrobacter sp. MI7-26]MCX2748089.1 TetR/AcrR family transcriptional regulator [Arthrobacter sp. MI7-26]